MLRKICQGRTQFLVDMFAENGHKKTFLETLVKDYNSKKKKMTVAITSTQRKSCGHLKWTKN